MAGTNNHGHTAEQIVDGLLEIVNTIHEKQPQAQVLVMVRYQRYKGYSILKPGGLGFMNNFLLHPPANLIFLAPTHSDF